MWAEENIQRGLRVLNMEKQKFYTTPPGSVFALAKSYEHGARSAETIRPGEDLSRERKSELDDSDSTDKRSAERETLRSKKR